VTTPPLGSASLVGSGQVLHCRSFVSFSVFCSLLCAALASGCQCVHWGVGSSLVNDGGSVQYGQHHPVPKVGGVGGVEVKLLVLQEVVHEGEAEDSAVGVTDLDGDVGGVEGPDREGSLMPGKVFFLEILECGLEILLRSVRVPDVVGERV